MQLSKSTTQTKKNLLHKKKPLTQIRHISPHASRLLTGHLNVIKHHRGGGRNDAIVCLAGVCAGVVLAHGVNQQVAEQEVGVVQVAQVPPVLCPRDLRGGDAAGHALQHQPLPFGRHDGAGRRRVDDARGFGGGAWERRGQSGCESSAGVICSHGHVPLQFLEMPVYLLRLKITPPDTKAPHSQVFHFGTS